MAVNYSTALKNARMNAITTEIGSNGRLKIYTSGAALLLADLALSATAAGAASGGVLTFSAITADSSADNTGTAALGRITKSDGTTVVVDGLTVGTSGTDIILNSVSIISGGTVSMAGPNTLTHP
jgi:hypothetical protein